MAKDRCTFTVGSNADLHAIVVYNVHVCQSLYSALSVSTCNAETKRKLTTTGTCTHVDSCSNCCQDQEPLLLTVEALKAQLEEQTHLCKEQVSSYYCVLHYCYTYMYMYVKQQCWSATWFVNIDSCILQL